MPNVINDTGSVEFKEISEAFQTNLDESSDRLLNLQVKHDFYVISVGNSESSKCNEPGRQI